mmetsp:Transcript_9202/g.22577  ORF Transcript_9202/g.22577 Transcript_9202/m.22577 type:complete len:204 (-) Transcript_9202:1282-1893(-)
MNLFLSSWCVPSRSFRRPGRGRVCLPCATGGCSARPFPDVTLRPFPVLAPGGGQDRGNLAAIQLELLGRRLELGQAVLVAVQDVDDVPDRRHGRVVPAEVPARGRPEGPQVGLVEGFEGLPKGFRHVVQPVLDALGQLVGLLAVLVGIERIQVALGPEDRVHLLLDLRQGVLELILKGPHPFESLLDLILLDHHPLGLRGERG